MFFMKKKQVEKVYDQDELYNEVLKDFILWWKSEEAIDPEKNKKNSLILNLGMFNISSAATPEGQDYLANQFGIKHTTSATIRLKDFYTHLIAKFGKREIYKLIDRTLDGMEAAHNVPMNTLKAIQRDIPTFWLLEMAHLCFQSSIVINRR